MPKLDSIILLKSSKRARTQANRQRTTKLNIKFESIPIMFDPKRRYPSTSPAIIAKATFAQDKLLSANMFDLSVFLFIFKLNFLSI